MLKTTNLTIGYGGKELLRGVNCEFEPGQIVAIRKAGMLDGSSTFLKSCAGIVQPLTGDVAWNGRSLNDFNAGERFKNFCYCYEIGGLISLFTVFNNIALPITYHRIFPRDEIQQRIYRVAQQMNIEPLLSMEPFQLNDVQTRLVNLARALVLDAQVLLIDEVQAGMPGEMVAMVAQILTEAARAGKAVVMVTTAGDDESFADQRYLINNQNLERVG